jgi:hypothetical protein
MIPREPPLRLGQAEPTKTGGWQGPFNGCPPRFFSLGLPGGESDSFGLQVPPLPGQYLERKLTFPIPFDIFPKNISYSI